MGQDRYAAAMQRSATTWVWLPFIALGFLWGTSYLWIKIGVETLPPLTLIGGRLTMGFIFLAIVVAVARQELPRSRRQYGHLLVMSVINIVIPFTLITVGEQSIDSALASILNAGVPLGVIILTPMFLPEEGLTAAKLVGLAVGFAGVMWLVAPGLTSGLGNNLPGELMMLGSTISYAAGNIYARRNVRGLRPMIPALFQVGFAAAIIVPLALIIDQPFSRVHAAPEAFVAIAWLGLLGSGAAYLCYFTILSHWGATRTSTVSYLLPVVGIAAGALVMGDPITPGRIGGTVLIVAGIAIVSSGSALRRLWDRRQPAPAR